MLRGKFIVLNMYIKKEEGNQWSEKLEIRKRRKKFKEKLKTDRKNDKDKF